MELLLTPLPDARKIQPGTTTASGPNFVVAVSNKAGYMNNIRLEATFDVPPDVIFAMFTAPGERGGDAFGV
jgi:hypothetical protein